MAAVTGASVKDRIIHEVSRAIKQAQFEWCLCGEVRGCTGRWLVVSLDAALLHGLRCLARGYWSAVAPLLDRTTLATISTLPYATTSLARGRSWVCLCLNEGQMESYLHALTSHVGLVEGHYATHALLRDPHRAHLLLMMTAGLEHLKFTIPTDVPGWIHSENSTGTSSQSSCTSLTPSTSSHLDTTCSEALEETWMSVEEGLPVSITKGEDSDSAIEIEHVSKLSSRKKRRSRSSSCSSSHPSSGDTTPTCTPAVCDIKAKAKDSIVTSSGGGGEERCGVGVGVEAQEQQQQQHEGTGDKVVLLRQHHNAQHTKSAEKRVSFTDSEDTEPSFSQRSGGVSLVGEGGRGMDLRDILTILKERGFLQPTSLSLDDLFTSLDQSSPLLSERAPPEGQEDPPLHQSITSLTTPPPPQPQQQQQHNNNNSNSNDESNNNTTDDAPTYTPTTATAERMKVGAKEHIGCFMDEQADILSGVRWEELTKMGQEMLRDEGGGVSLPPTTTTTSTRRELLASYAAHVLNQEHVSKSGGTKPKFRQRAASDHGSHSQRGSLVAGMGAAAQHKRITVLERRRRYRQMYIEDRRLPSLYISAQVDPSAFKDEEHSLALEVAQGQSNTVLPGHPTPRHTLINQLFTHPQETLYKVFSVREGHSSGASTGVWVVLSSHALYIVTPLPPGVRTRHKLPYTHIHTIIVGGNDQWVCILSKDVVEGGLKSIGGDGPGVQLEVGDPDLTHSLMSCLEVAVRRHLSSLRALAPIPPAPTQQQYLPTPRPTATAATSGRHNRLGHSGDARFGQSGRSLLQELTRECADNFSNSLLESSLLSAWETTTKTNLDDLSPASDFSQEDSSATPSALLSGQEAHIDVTTEEASDVSREDVTDVSQDHSEASQELTESSDVSQAASDDVSEMSNGTSRESIASEQSVSQVSSQSVSSQHSVTGATTSQEVWSEGSAASTVSSAGSTGGEGNVTHTPSSSSDETPTSSDLVQSVSSLSEMSDANPGPATTPTTVRDAGGRCSPVRLTLQDQHNYTLVWGTPVARAAHMYNTTCHSLPAVVVHPTWELTGVRNWLSSQLHLKNVGEVCQWWLVDWEDGSSLGGGGAGPLGPTKEGPLMFRPPGILTPWRPAYFILKAGVLYQFNDAKERLPHMIVEAGQCVGCVRLPYTHRPHAFQLLRRDAAPLLLAASDEDEASLWLQALLTTINTGMRDVSERSQLACRVVLLESGLLLAQQSNLFLGPCPTPSPVSSHTPTTLTSEDDKPGTNQQQQLQQPLRDISAQNLGVLERKDWCPKAANQTVSNLKERRPLSASLTGLNSTNSLSSIPGSPVKRPTQPPTAVSDSRSPTPVQGAITSTPKHHHHRRQYSLSRLPSDCSSSTSKVTPERRHSASKFPLSPRKQQKQPPPHPHHHQQQQQQQQQQREGLGGGVGLDDTQHKTPRRMFRGSGEMKILTYSSLEHLASVSLYTECPTTCLLEFECSEAGEISGDWALYFRTGRQLHEFISLLSHAWSSVSQVEFPLQQVDNEGVKQFLLEGSQISANGWSCLHL